MCVYVCVYTCIRVYGKVYCEGEGAYMGGSMLGMGEDSFPKNEVQETSCLCSTRIFRVYAVLVFFMSMQYSYFPCLFWLPNA